MKSRRDFLRWTGVGLAGAFTVPALAELSSSSTDMPDKALRISQPDKYWKQIRKQFAIRKPLIYLNNGTMGLSPKPVVAAVHRAMADADEGGLYTGIEQAAQSIARFVGADEKEIALTHNVTEGINIAAWGFPLNAGDEVIMTTHEHVGGCVPWLQRAHLEGIVIKTIELGTGGKQEVLSRLDKVLSPKTKVIAVPHIPCTQGQVLPIKEIISLAKSKGIYTMIDGAHGPGMLNMNLHELGCDVYVSCCHKWMLGPKGTGFIYVRKDFQDTLQARFIGAGGDKGWDMTVNPPQFKGLVDSAHRYYYGTQNHALFVGVTKAIEFLESIGKEAIEERVKNLGQYTRQRLSEIGAVEFLTPEEPESRAAVNGFRIKGIEYNEITKAASEAHIRIRGVAEGNLNSLRVSTHIYNQTEEIDQFIDVLKKRLAR